MSPAYGGYWALWLNSAERGAYVPRIRGLSGEVGQVSGDANVCPLSAGVIGACC